MGEGQEAGSKDRWGLLRLLGHSRLLPDIDPGAHDVIRRHGLKGEESLLAWEAPGACAWEQEGCVEVLCLAARSKPTSWLRMVHRMPGHHVTEDNRGPGSILHLPPQARKIPPQRTAGAFQSKSFAPHGRDTLLHLHEGTAWDRDSLVLPQQLHQETERPATVVLKFPVLWNVLENL